MARSLLRAILSHPGSYEGVDPVASRRVTAALLALSAVLTLAFLPLDPPSESIGWPGWVVAAALVAGKLATARRVVDVSRPVGYDALLAIAYGGVAAVALLQWLAGEDSPYGLLFVLWLGGGAVHPPRRAFVYLGVLVGAVALPLLHGGYDSALGTRVVAEELLLVAIGVVLIAYLFTVRVQRAGLRAGAEVARRLARVDSLTGLGNRRALNETLLAEADRAVRERRPLSVALLDLDGLKRINDRFGHIEGDRCLREAARGIEAALRANDLCFRWGGDEFVILLPGTDAPGAELVVARVAERVAAVCRDPNGDEVSLSYGVGELDVDMSAEDLLAHADVALLEQKTRKRR
jgi:diguanylate cyclase (GGDEF)-like protein